MIDKKFVVYEKVAKSFRKFFNTDELEKRINRKADLAMVKDINELKADKTTL